MILTNITLGDAGITAALGYAVVFFGLILLMIVVTIMGKAFVAADKKKTVAVPAPVALTTSTSLPTRFTSTVSFPRGVVMKPLA